MSEVLKAILNDLRAASPYADAGEQDVSLVRMKRDDNLLKNDNTMVRLAEGKEYWVTARQAERLIEKNAAERVLKEGK